MQGKPAATVLAILSASAAAPASASDPSGMWGMLFHFYLVLPWALLQLAVFGALALFDTYRSRTAAVRHAWIAAIGPMAGFVALLLDSRNAALAASMALVDALALALAMLPLGMHAIHRRRAERRAAQGEAPPADPSGPGEG